MINLSNICKITGSSDFAWWCKAPIQGQIPRAWVRSPHLWPHISFIWVASVPLDNPYFHLYLFNFWVALSSINLHSFINMSTGKIDVKQIHWPVYPVHYYDRTQGCMAPYEHHHGHIINIKRLLIVLNQKHNVHCAINIL